ncbi:MAG TPA: carbohydrate ABC transporter permease [Tepidisphaeraceae bacterium]|nr:carbohydrate ABC transporter permease [Tepidisphaeraceae bacterium]
MTPLQLTILALIILGLPIAVISARLSRGYYRYLAMIFVAVIMLLPFAWLFCAVIKDKDILNAYTFLPPFRDWSKTTLNLNNFRDLLQPHATMQGPVSFWRYILNSLFLASASTTITLFFSSLSGYALAKFRFPGQRLIMTFMLASMTIPGVVLLAPNFETIYHLGWMDTYKSLLVPGAVSVFGVFLFRQAFLPVPDEIIEAGRIDGCSEFRIYLTLVLPLVRPMIGAFCLIAFLGSWNSFIAPNVFLQSQDKLTLPVILNQYVGEYQQQYGVFLAGTLLAILPPAILFFALQREFISGLTTGAVKQ